MQRDDVAGNEFDAWMGGTSAAGAAPEAAAEAPQAPGTSAGGAAKRAGARSKLMKPSVLVPCALGLVVGVLVLVRGGEGEAPAETGQYAQVAPLETADLPTVDTGAQSAPGNAAPYAAPPQAADFIPAPAPAGPEPTAQAGLAAPLAPEPVPAAPVQAAPAAPAPVAAAASPPAAAPAAAGDPQGELARRVSSLEGDLDRAQQARRADRQRIQRLERELSAAKAKAKEGDYTVVAVLNDGVVVRSGAGSERVYAVGSRIEQ